MFNAHCLFFFFLPVSCFSLDFYDGLDTFCLCIISEIHKESQSPPKYSPLSGCTSVSVFPHKHMQAIQKARRNINKLKKLQTLKHDGKINWHRQNLNV